MPTASQWAAIYYFCRLLNSRRFGRKRPEDLIASDRNGLSVKVNIIYMSIYEDIDLDICRYKDI